jgi:hypothetical protein
MRVKLLSITPKCVFPCSIHALFMTYLCAIHILSIYYPYIIYALSIPMHCIFLNIILSGNGAN